MLHPGRPAPAGANAPARGGAPLRFWGGALGQADYSAAVRLGNTAAARTRWEGDTSVVARVAAGAAPGGASVVTVGGGALSRVATLSGALTYDAARVRSVVAHVVTITRAAAFAAVGAPVVADRVAGGVMSAAASAAADAPGPEGDGAPAAQVANVPATPRVHPVLTRLLAAANTAPHDHSARVRQGGSASEATRWLSDSSLSARPAAGAAVLHCNAAGQWPPDARMPRYMEGSAQRLGRLRHEWEPGGGLGNYR